MDLGPSQCCFCHFEYKSVDEHLCGSSADPLALLFSVSQVKSEMDSYLSPQDVANPRMLCRDASLKLEPPYAEDLASPYSVNMSLLLPDVTYLHPGLCGAVRPIKSEPASHPLMQAPCQAAGAPLPEYPGAFGSADAPGGSFFIKQEVQDFQDMPLFQLLNSDLEQLVHGSQLNSVPMATLSLPPVGSVQPGPLQSPPKASASPHCFQRHQQRPSYLPPSPPSSEPASPDRGKELLHNLSPPPSYEASIASKLTFQAHHPMDPAQASSVAPIQSPGSVQIPGPVGPVSPVLAQSAPFKNRRNNPDLERRRIHHCNVPGEPHFYL